MRISFLIVGLLLSMTACKSMSERGTASVNPQVETQETTPPKETTTPKDNPLNKYYQNIVKKLKTEVADNSNRRWERCEDGEGPSCMKSTCAQGGYDCRTQYYLDKVMDLCQKSGSDGECIQDVCKQGAYDCKTQYYLDKVVEICREARGGCVRAICKPGAYDCKTQYYLDKVIDICKKNFDPRCVSDICAQGAYDCKTQYYLDKVIDTCSKR